jgi:1-acyl-sn-glycerol-3-phosphate acyltransferase
VKRLPTIVDTSGRFMRLGAKLAINPHHLTADGLEHVPTTGPVILAVRHYHHLLDGLGLLAQVNRPLHIMIGLDWVSTRPSRWLMEGLARCCAWPVTLRNAEDLRAGPDTPTVRASAYAETEIRPYQLRAYRQCVELLGQGRAVALFPEGYPLIDPHAKRPPRTEAMAPFKSGFARLALTAARRQGGPISVVPVGIRTDAQNSGKLAFAYGPPRQVTHRTDVDALIAQTRHDIGLLSS